MEDVTVLNYRLGGVYGPTVFLVVVTSILAR
jgi:hypothetical protein